MHIRRGRPTYYHRGGNPRRLREACRVHPTQIYSTIDGLVLCLLLLAYAPFRRHDGEVFAILMSIYPVTRFVIEGSAERRGAGVRHGSEHFAERQPSILLCAAALWFYVLRQPKGTAFGAGARDERRGTRDTV